MAGRKSTLYVRRMNRTLRYNLCINEIALVNTWYSRHPSERAAGVHCYPKPISQLEPGLVPVYHCTNSGAGLISGTCVLRRLDRKSGAIPCSVEERKPANTSTGMIPSAAGRLQRRTRRRGPRVL